MTVQINYKSSKSKKDLSNLVLFVDEKFNINNLKKYLSNLEFSYISDLLKNSDLKKDLLDVPRRSCDRKVNEFVKRVRACMTHAKIIAHLRKQMPVLTGHADKQKRLLDDVEIQFQQCIHEHNIPRGDMPNPKRFREIMKGIQVWKLPKIDKKQMQALEEVLSVDLPRVMREFDNPF